MFLALVPIIVPVLAVVVLGYAWQRSGSPYDSRFVTRLVTLVGTPCLIFSTLTRLEVSAAVFGEIVLAGIATLVCFAVLGVLALRLMGLPARRFLPALIFPNAGNLGLPLSLFAFGEEGLALAIAFFSLVAIAQFTVGQSIAAGTPSVGRVLRTPLIYVLALAIAMLALGVSPPRWLDNTVGLLAGIAIPLLLISLGCSLARLDRSRWRAGVAVSVVRLVMGFGVSVIMAALFNLDPVARGVLIIQSSAPPAVFNFLFAQYYGTGAEEVGGAILVATAIYFLLLPPLLLFVL